MPGFAPSLSLACDFGQVTHHLQSQFCLVGVRGASPHWGPKGEQELKGLFTVPGTQDVLSKHLELLLPGHLPALDMHPS